jgi:hypothetical protein
VPEDSPFFEFFKRLPPEFRGQPTPRPTQAQGSGFVISPDGFVVTNNHVIDGANKITVNFDQDTKYEAELVGTDARTDLALLKLKGGSGNFPYVKFADKQPRVGDWVVAVGNPFGLGGTVTAGIVSALGRDIGSGPYDYMQIDACREPRQLGWSDLQPRRRGGWRQHRHLQPVGRQRRHRLRRAGQGGNRGDHATQVGWLGQPRLARREDPERRRGHGGEPRLGEAKGALVSEVTTPVRRPMLASSRAMPS